jgi:hypothetical protein
MNPSSYLLQIPAYPLRIAEGMAFISGLFKHTTVGYYHCVFCLAVVFYLETVILKASLVPKQITGSVDVNSYELRFKHFSPEPAVRFSPKDVTDYAFNNAEETATMGLFWIYAEIRIIIIPCPTFDQWKSMNATVFSPRMLIKSTPPPPAL